MWFVGSMAVCGLILLLLGLRGATAEAIGSFSGFLTILLFALWELGRWRVRRAHPVKRV
jgi:hypothetical protein